MNTIEAPTIILTTLGPVRTEGPSSGTQWVTFLVNDPTGARHQGSVLDWLSELTDYNVRSINPGLYRHEVEIAFVVRASRAAERIAELAAAVERVFTPRPPFRL